MTVYSVCAVTHNDCQSSTKQCPCHKDYPTDRTCTKHFPRDFQDVTVWDEQDIYPRYKRRRSSKDTVHNGRVIDNRWYAERRRRLTSDACQCTRTLTEQHWLQRLMFISPVTHISAQAPLSVCTVCTQDNSLQSVAVVAIQSTHKRRSVCRPALRQIPLQICSQKRISR